MIPFIVMVADLATLSTIRRGTGSTHFFLSALQRRRLARRKEKKKASAEVTDKPITKSRPVWTECQCHHSTARVCGQPPSRRHPNPGVLVVQVLAFLSRCCPFHVDLRKRGNWTMRTKSRPITPPAGISSLVLRLTSRWKAVVS